MPKTRRNRQHTNSPANYNDHQLLLAYKRTLDIDPEQLHEYVCEQARCAEVDLDLWYLETDFQIHGKYDPIRICATCPVQEECLILALRLHETQHGIWGGCFSHQRSKMLNRLQEMLN